MISFRAYGLIEDAWADGIADWCRRASGHVLGGGQAWMVTTGDGQANWIKRRLLCEGTSLFGVEFLDARSLRRAFCRRRGVAPPTMGRHALEFLLRLYALTHEGAHPALAAVARHPGACLAALDSYAAAGWLAEGPGLFGEILPAALHGWLPLLRATGSWVPEVDQGLARVVDEAPEVPVPPLALCVAGWDAVHWPLFDLLVGAVRNAGEAEIYSPLPRGTSEAIQQHWLQTLEEIFQTSFEPCDASDFISAQSVLAARLEGSDLASAPGAAKPAPPELLAGHDTGDMVALVCDFVARWLAERPTGKAGRNAADGGQRLVILCPARDVSSVGVVKALAAAGIAVEDEVGEQPEPSLAIQVQRAVIAYHRDEADIGALLALIELLNELAALAPDPAHAPLLARVCPLDPVEVRRALHGAFADLQHHSARVLGKTASLGRTEVARPLHALLDHLGTWLEMLPWPELLARWEHCLDGFGLTTEVLEPLWSQLAGLPVQEPVPSAAFFQFLSGILAGVPPRRAAEGMNRFARVVVTSLEGAMGQTWGGALFLDSNEGAWPIYPGENPFLDDADCTRLNTRRAAAEAEGRPTERGYLLTAADRAQLEHFRFLEILENCAGPLAFAGVARDPAEPGKELYANEWALRCLVESGRAPAEGEKLLDRWRDAVRRVRRTPPALPAKESAHLREVVTRRRDAGHGFDAYFFNFSELTAPDELPWTDAWSSRDLETVWSRPATFALQKIFAAEPWREGGGALSRRENWVVGRMVHGWLRTALRASQEPRLMQADDWRHALGEGLASARAGTETALRRSLDADDAAGLPFWWRSTLGRAEWTARRCLETLAEAAQSPDPAGGPVPARWLCLERTFQVDLKTTQGPLRLKARCDAVLLDRPTFDEAGAILVDIRTGSAPPTGSPTTAQLEGGQGLGLGTLFLMGVAQGLDPAATRAGVIHPDASNLAQWTDEQAALLEPVVGRLAATQRSLVYGQKGALAVGHRREDAESLPLATLPVAPAVLAAKAAVTDGAGGGKADDESG